MGCARAILAKLKSNFAELKNSDKRPLLDMCPGERREIILYNSIQGFAYVSAVPGAVTSTVDALSAAHIISSARAAATFVSASSLFGLSVAGTAAGMYFARQQVAEENEKIIQLNKELFILFNIATDRWEEHKRLNQLPTGTPDKAQQIKNAEARYQNAVKSIQKAILSNNTVTVNTILTQSPSTKKGDTQLTSQFTPGYLILVEAVMSYANRRSLAQGLDEKALWDRLKIQKGIFRTDEDEPKAIDNFIKYSSDKQIKKFFDNENKKLAKMYQKKRSELESILTEIKDTSEITAELMALRSILDVICEPNASQEAVIENISQADRSYDAIILKVPAGRRDAFEAIWLDLRKRIVERNEHLTHCYDETSRQNANDTTKIFGELGSFREFWRNTANRKLPNDNEECISHNLDQMIHRGDAKLGAKEVAEKSILTAASLYSTGQGLYFAIIVFGAAAMSSTVVGLIVVAIAVSLTLLCMACYIRSQKTQRDRGEVFKRFETARKLLVADEVRNSTQAVQSREINDADVSSHKEEKEEKETRLTLPASPGMRLSTSATAA